MQKLSKVLVGIAVIAGIIIAGSLLGLWGSRGTPPSTVQLPVEPVPPPEPASTPSAPLASRPPEPPPPAMATNPGPLNPDLAQTEPPANPGNLITNWEDRVDQILSSDGDDTNKVNQMFAMFPRLPKDGQVEVAQHLSNLVPDEGYAPLGQMLEDAKLPQDVLDVLMSDVLNRPNSTKLPVLLNIAQNPDHPEAADAKDLLELYLDEDYGNDWPMWQQKMQEWLKDNPD
jgi:hypothetical protein